MKKIVNIYNDYIGTVTDQPKKCHQYFIDEDTKELRIEVLKKVGITNPINYQEFVDGKEPDACYLIDTSYDDNKNIIGLNMGFIEIANVPDDYSLVSF